MSTRERNVSSVIVDVNSKYGEAANNFISTINTAVKGVIRTELVSVGIYGVPTTGGEPDWDFYRIMIDEMPFGSIGTTSTTSGLVILLKGQTNIFEPSDELIQEFGNPRTFQQLNIRVYRPDNKLCSTSDISGLHIKLRFWIDYDAQNK